MKKILFLTLHILFLSNLSAQSTYKNYIKETAYRTPSNGGLQIYSAQNFENIIYFDGTGRPEQLIEKNASPVEQKNIVKHIEYTNYIGQTKDYLPFTAVGREITGSGIRQQTKYNGDFINNAGTETLNFYNSEEKEFTQNPFSEIKTKNNLRGDISEIASPGTDWSVTNGHTTKIDRATNTVNEVKWFKANASWNNQGRVYRNTIVPAVFFAPNTLKKEIIKNENWTSGKNNTVEIFKSSDGKVHLKRRYDNNIAHDTYYVYNQFGHLSFILSPEGSDASALSQEILNELCFQYNYNADGQLVEKKVPGKKWEYRVYDKAGRIALSGPNLSPFGDSSEGWMFVKHDYLNRPVYKGFYNGTNADAATRASLEITLKNQTEFNEKRLSNAATIDGVGISYSNQVFPNTSLHILEINYFDSYGYAGGPASPPNVNGNTPNTKVKGLLTGIWTRNITTPTEKKGDVTYLVYDEKYRPIQVNVANTQGGLTRVTSTYNFFGNPTRVETFHRKNVQTPSVTTVETFSYNSREYLLKHTHSINNRPEELIASYEYDDLGKLIRKNTGNTESQPLQKIDYQYNVRGWLKQLNDPDNLDKDNDNDLFGLQVNYNSVSATFPQAVKKQYNGNTTSAVWKTRTDNIKRGYAYMYDDLDRLKSALSIRFSGKPSLSEEQAERASYSKNGNITFLYRTAGSINGQIEELDDAELRYQYNKLTSVMDHTGNPEGLIEYDQPGNAYEYDTYGNLIVDKTRNITQITYNHFNQPLTLLFASGAKIAFTYNSFGQRIKKTVTQQNTTDIVEYLDGYEYKNNVLKYIATPEGFVIFENGQFNYAYQYRDQLGNVRLTYQDKNKNGTIENTEILNENNYYPFGLKHRNYNQLANQFSNSLMPNAGFNGQPELVDLNMNNISLMDFRLYDAALGRFLGADMLADAFNSHSPYHFGYNNPLSYVDPTGLNSRPSPGNQIVIGDKGDVAVYYTDENGDTAAIFFVQPKQPNEMAQTDRRFGTDPHMGRSGGGPTGGSGAGPSGGPGGRPGGESNNMYKDPSEFLNNANFINDRIGDGADILANTQNKGGSLGVWKNSANSFKIRYYSSNWKGNQYTGKTANISKMLKKGTVVASAVLGAIEVSQGVAQDYQNYQTIGYTDGRNTAVAVAKVGVGIAVGYASGWAAGAATGALIGSSVPIVGTIVGAVVGGLMSYYAGEFAGQLVEDMYNQK